MRYPLLIVALLAVALLTCVPGCDDVKYDLRLVLEKWTEAQRQGDGNAMLEILDPKCVEYYDRVVGLARTATRQEIGRLPAVERYWIAVIRATFTGAELRTLDGSGFVRRVRGRQAPEEWMPDFSLGRVEHRSPRASAELLESGEPTGLRMEFVQIDQRWYLDDRCFNEMFNRAVARNARRIDRSEDYVVLAWAARYARKNFDDRIWDAPPK
jgi:hypothetical protein